MFRSADRRWKENGFHVVRAALACCRRRAGFIGGAGKLEGRLPLLPGPDLRRFRPVLNNAPWACRA